MFLDPVQDAPLLPAPAQAPPPLPAPVQAPPVVPAPVLALPFLPAPIQTSPSLPAPVQAPRAFSDLVQAPAFLQVKSKKDEEEDKLSDVETEGYCDDKNPPDIITKLRTVKRQGMKDLYDNDDQVILTMSAIVSLLEVFFPSLY